MKNIFEKDKEEVITRLVGMVGREISDNFSPTCRSRIVKYLGNEKFVLENRGGRKIVPYWRLDTMVFGS